MKTLNKLKLNWKQASGMGIEHLPIWYVKSDLDAERDKPIIRIERLIMETGKPYLVELMGYHRMIFELNVSEELIMELAEKELKKIIKHLHGKLNIK